MYKFNSVIVILLAKPALLVLLMWQRSLAVSGVCSRWLLTCSEGGGGPAELGDEGEGGLQNPLPHLTLTPGGGAGPEHTTRHDGHTPNINQ